MFTKYHYDGDRLIGSVTTHEPEWDEADRLSVLAELERRRMTGAHGQPMDEATDPSVPTHDAKYKYVAEPYTDFAQKALDDAAAAYRNEYGADVPAGLRWSVKKVMRA